ncbi:MAG: HNH endonuclease [Sphingobacterium sp.]|jgi:5-methylcytosine-specific restriction endonuclease McrA|nr:HNH endonuclease [Sphingobacterium sp.]
MADIENSITYTPQIKQRISELIAKSDFKSSDWSEEDISDIRKYIRDYYRDLTKKCFYCRKDISIKSANGCHVEHIIPKSKSLHFMFEPKNLCVVCNDCNEIKNNKEVLGKSEKVTKENRDFKRYPRSSNAFLVVHPHFDNYDDHIFRRGDIYIDKSPKGSYTIYICELNRKIHKYGMDSMALTQSELFDLFNNIMNEANYSKQIGLMNKLQEFFIRL